MFLVAPKKIMGLVSSVTLVLMMCVMNVATPAQDFPDISDGDEFIAAIFLQVNDVDIENARLLQRSLVDSEVMKIPRMILEEHVPIRARFVNLLKILGIQPVLPEAYGGYWEEDRFREDLKLVSRKDAGTLYIDYEYVFSKQVVDLIEDRLIPTCHDGQLKAFLVGVLPQMRRHLLHISMYREMPRGRHGKAMMHHQH